MDVKEVNGESTGEAQLVCLDDGPSPEGSGPSPEGSGPSPDGSGPSPEGSGPSPEGSGPSPETKGSIRTKVWQDLQKKKLSVYSSPYYRIPNFKGVEEASRRLADLPEYKSASTVEVNPDKPLEACRILVLEDGKELYVPVPGLRDGLLKKLERDEVNDLRKVVSRWGIDHLGKPVGEDEKVAIDMVVVGSVAVSRDGYRIGKGAGYADMEFAILKELGIIGDETTIVTIVHDVQVLETLPENLFQPHDVPVDYILTPTETIKTQPKAKRPAGIFWDIVTYKKLDSITALQKLRKKHEAEGRPVTIKNGSKRRRSYRPHRKAEEAEGGKERVRKQEKQHENVENIPPAAAKSKRPKKSKKLSPSYSLLVTNIQKGIKAKQLKIALQEKGIKPSWITWRGVKGFCKLHYTAKVKTKLEDVNENDSFNIDNIIELIQNIRLSSDSTQSLEVKVVEPITRIETMNVTAV